MQSRICLPRTVSLSGFELTSRPVIVAAALSQRHAGLHLAEKVLEDFVLLWLFAEDLPMNIHCALLHSCFLLMTVPRLDRAMIAFR